MMPPIAANVVDLSGGKGFTYKLYEPGRAVPFRVTHGHKSSDIDVLGSLSIQGKDASLEGTFTAPETATYYFTCSGLGPSKLMFDDQIIYEQTDSCKDAMGFLFGGSAPPEVKFSLEKGRQYKVLIRTSPPSKTGNEDLGILEGRIGVRIGHMAESEHDKDLLSDAVEVAKAADVAVVFVGHEPFWETEGQDQVSFSLPKDGSQDRLIKGVAKVNPNTIVVNNTGVAVDMPWLDEIQALVQAWFPGQEVGNSIADVLTGRQNPEGHLTCTIPKRLEDCPAYGNFPGKRDENGRLQVSYEEGIFVGYRHFDRLPADKVNFHFGHGLSYTTFDFSDLSVKEAGEEGYAVDVTVSNTGGVAGATAVQIYVGQYEVPSEDPVKVLAAFSKVGLQPGEAKTVSLPVAVRDFASFDEAARKWVVRGGEYKFTVGRSAGDAALETGVTVKKQAFDP